MKIYQPMLFVGLGGTGCRIGAALENRLRTELCGPDGTALIGNDKRAPYQLPDCLQFVYADFNEGDLARLPHLRASGPRQAAYARTARATHDLLPRQRSSPEVTRMLRVALHEEVASWLPPETGEPKVAPLRDGAGQLPTVGRAALFATLRNSLQPVLAPIREAVDAIARSGGDLLELGGNGIRGCDVYVAFSVAGGTGAGIFLDYLHLVGQVLEDANIRVKIYPLVTLPSAFDLGRGGGREAELNAGRSLIDLFRLVDSQNVPEAADELGDVTLRDAAGIDYPGAMRVVLPTSTVQTAFLFTRTAGMRPEDLHQSIVSLVMSLLGTELGDDRGGRRDTDQHQSFAASFVNEGVFRAARAPSGIGHRGVSTSLVASMTVPVDELAEIVAARLLAAAVRRLGDATSHAGEDNRARVRQFFTDARLEPLWVRDPLPLSPDPTPPPRGGTAISAALSARLEEMSNLLGDLGRVLVAQVDKMARDFAPRAAVYGLLRDREVDLFRLQRVLDGTAPGGGDPVSTAGFAGMLESRRNEPARQDGVGVDPPRTTRIRGRLGGAVRARWGDPDVLAALDEQDRWYTWRSRLVWHAAWKEHENRWGPATAQVRRELAGILDAFRAHEAGEGESFKQRTRELYRDRTGVSYLLPPQGNLRDFYADVVERLLRQAGLREQDDEGDLLLALVEPEEWRKAYDDGIRSPRSAVGRIKNIVEQRVKRLFQEAGTVGERPLLPPLADLLAAAVGDEAVAATVSKEALRQFSHQLASLLPGGFTPEGSGSLKTLIVYPKTHADDAVKNLLKRDLHLPDEESDPDFRAASSDSITVVLFRSNMSLGEVPEVRRVLGTWARALRNEGPEDHLRWRQRLGWNDDWLASTEEDRRHITHRLLCAMWNGQVEHRGRPESPSRVRVSLGEGGRAAMTLTLEGYDRDVSSWGSLLHAYERWVLLDAEPITEDFTAELMQTLPRGVDREPQPPADLYRIFVHEVAPTQADLLEKLGDRLGAEARDWIAPLHSFWADTVPGALRMRFPRVQRPIRASLLDLESVPARVEGDRFDGDRFDGDPYRGDRSNGGRPGGVRPGGAGSESGVRSMGDRSRGEQ